MMEDGEIMDGEIVNGYVVDGFNCSIAQLWGSGPKLTIKCSGCGRYYEKRVAPSHKPKVICPLCGRINILDITV